jgi:hypothetical protein
MRMLSTVLFAVCVAVCVACAPPDELGGVRAPPDVTSTARQLVAGAEIGGGFTARTLTLALDERVVWSCSLETTCASDDIWYQGPGLYTFAMGDDFAADVFVRDETLRVQLRIIGDVREDGSLDLWHVRADAFTDGNNIATLQREGGSFSFANTSGVQLVKQSMIAALERWDGGAWRDVPRDDIWLCGNGWNPRVDVDEVEHVYLPLGAHHRAMNREHIETTGTYRVRYPFRVVDEEEPRIATVVMELDEETFAPRTFD